MFSSMSKNQEFFFHDPRLGMTVPGRLLVHVVSGVSYVLLAVSAFAFIISDLAYLRGLGILLGLLFLDRFLHAQKADRHLSELPSSGRVNLANFLSPQAYGTLERAYDRSILKRSDLLLEIAWQLFQGKDVKMALVRLDLKPEEFKHKLEELIAESRSSEKRSEEKMHTLEELCVGALEEALANKQPFIESPDVFAVLPKLKCQYMHRLLSTFSLAPGDISQAMIFSSAAKQFSRLRILPHTLNSIILGGENRLRHRIMNRAWTSRPTPALDRVSTDLTDAARGNQVGFLVGHEAEYEHLIKVLSRPDHPNALLVGEPGIGKGTIVEHLAFNLIKDQVPRALFDKRIVELHLSALVASAPGEELQRRLAEIVSEIEMAGNVILYIPDIHNLVRTSGTAYLSAADALLPVIENDAFPVIGSTYSREHKQFIESRSDFSAAFETIRVEEISPAEAERILTYEALILERRKRVTISFGAVKTAVKLARRYFRDKFLPASAEELLKSAVVAIEEQGGKFLGPDEVVAIAEERVNIPIHSATSAEAESLLHLEDVIHKEFIDQEEAVKAVSDALRQYRSGLARKGGPIASFLFVGPTGVGKTELSKILTRIQFGSEGAMVRFDMTEYQDKQSFFRFIGSPDGQVSGALTEAILKKPYSLVLLDEFEKAHPDILNLFLQVLDDGRLTDNLGRTVDFTNTIVIATSNAHSDIINESLRSGEKMSQIAEYLKSRLTDVFKPELLNRFSKIIVFHDLSPENVMKIAELNLEGMGRMIFDDQGISLRFEEPALKLVAKQGFDPAFGARPLRRVIDEQVRAPLAELLLSGKIRRGDRVRVAAEGEKLRIQAE